jgi:hypothetical protein
VGDGGRQEAHGREFLGLEQLLLGQAQRVLDLVQAAADGLKRRRKLLRLHTQLRRLGRDFLLQLAGQCDVQKSPDSPDQFAALTSDRGRVSTQEATAWAHDLDLVVARQIGVGIDGV